MTDITFTDEELGLLKRVLSFASQDVPITDFLGNKIYPTYEARLLALTLENRLTEAGIATPGKLYTAFDPEQLVGKLAVVRWVSEADTEHNVRGVIGAVVEDLEVKDDGTTGWTVVFRDGSEFYFPSRDELQANSRVELEQEAL